MIETLGIWLKEYRYHLAGLVLAAQIIVYFLSPEEFQNAVAPGTRMFVRDGVIVITETTGSVSQEEILALEENGVQCRGVTNDLLATHQNGYNGIKPACPSSTDFPKGNRKTFMYLLSSVTYLNLLKISLCSLREHNPDIPVSVGLGVDYFSDDLPDFVDKLITELNVTVVLFPKLEFSSAHTARFSRNWLKLRLWQLEDHFDSVFFIDADSIVGADLSYVFDLPFRMAATMDLDKSTCSFETLQSGVFFMRPCKATFLHMLSLVQNNPWLTFPGDHAEQSFLHWYFYYDRAVLPAAFHVIEHSLKSGRAAMFHGVVSEEEGAAVGDGDLKPVKNPSDGVDMDDLPLEQSVKVLHLVQKKVHDVQIEPLVQHMLGSCHDMSA